MDKSANLVALQEGTEEQKREIEDQKRRIEEQERSREEDKGVIDEQKMKIEEQRKEKQEDKEKSFYLTGKSQFEATRKEKAQLVDKMLSVWVLLTTLMCKKFQLWRNAMLHQTKFVFLNFSLDHLSHV